MFLFEHSIYAFESVHRNVTCFVTPSIHTRLQCKQVRISKVLWQQANKANNKAALQAMSLRQYQRLRKLQDILNEVELPP